jgi:hypothetical protein
MGMSKKAIVVLVPSLLFGIGAPAWSGTAEQAAPVDAQVMPANSNSNTLLGMLKSVLTGTDPGSRQPKGQCNASNLYSQHDVVGDPEACFMNRYITGNGSSTAVGIP